MARRENDFYYIENHQFEDEALHNPILAEGDHAAARKISDQVARKIGLTEAEILALRQPAKQTKRYRAFDPDEPRDETGKWTDGGGDSGGESQPSSSPHAKDPTSASSLLRTGKTTVHDLYNKVPGSKEQDMAARSKLLESRETDKIYKLPNGHWAPDRLPVHRAILAKLLPLDRIAAATPPPGEKPTLYVLGGRGGSGKGWFTRPGGSVDISKAVYINNDDVKESLPEYRGWNAGHLHEEASEIGEAMEAYARDNKLNVVVDATLKSEGSLAKRIAAYKAAGYRISGHYMYASPATAAERALQRFVSGNAKNGKGRFVPPEYSLNSTTNEHTFDSHRKDMDYWEVYDNSGDAPKLHSRKE